MGKKRHSKDKMYIISSEYSRDWGGWKKKLSDSRYHTLPFYCCGLSLLPFEDPVCFKTTGIVYDVKNVVPWIKKHQSDPATGQPVSLTDLIPLKFHKNSQGKMMCPITSKEFNHHSHIVANLKSGNVYSNDAITNLCRRPNNWRDLISDEKFSPSDLLTIQDPERTEFREISRLYYQQNIEDIGLTQVEGGGKAFSGIKIDTTNPSINMTALEKRILDAAKATEETVKETHKRLFAAPEQKNAAPSISAKHTIHTTGATAASFTSTVAPRAVVTEYRSLTEREVRQILYDELRAKRRAGKNVSSYVRLVTSLGLLNFELFCDKAPETCHNFIRHAHSGYYDNTTFHRCIEHFMVQGGDPLGDGTGGASSFKDGAPFPDEFHPHLTHTGPGILSMANSGPNTNKSQFFITFASCQQLDRKHTVFGKLVRGMETLKKFEKLATDKDDRPKQPPKLLKLNVFKDSFAEIEQQQKSSAEKEKSGDTSAGAATIPAVCDPEVKRQRIEALTRKKILASKEGGTSRSSMSFASW